MYHLHNDHEVLQVAEKIRADREYRNLYGEAKAVQEPKPQSRIEPSNADIVAHHSPDGDQINRITTIRAAARNFLDAIDSNCPQCADKSAAKRSVREAMMTANAAIVLNGAI